MELTATNRSQAYPKAENGLEGREQNGAQSDPGWERTARGLCGAKVLTKMRSIFGSIQAEQREAFEAVRLGLTFSRTKRIG